MFKKIVLCMLLCVGAVYAKQLHFVFISNGLDVDPFWNVIKNGINDAAKEVGARVDYRSSPTGDRTEMARILQAAISQRPDGIIISIPDKDALGKDIKRALDLKIPVINVNAGVEAGKELGIKNYIGSNEYQGGMLLGEQAKKAGIKSFVCVNQEITNTVLEQRCQGFADGLGVKNNMIDSSSDPSEIQKRLAPYLDKVDAIVTLGPVSAGATIGLLKSKRIKKHFVTFDLSPEIIAGIKEGVLLSAIDQQPYLQGYLPVILLSKYVPYGLLPDGDIYTGPALVTKENVDLVDKLTGKFR